MKFLQRKTTSKGDSLAASAAAMFAAIVAKKTAKQ